jgi:hypothetical protein
MQGLEDCVFGVEKLRVSVVSVLSFMVGREVD